MSGKAKKLRLLFVGLISVLALSSIIPFTADVFGCTDEDCLVVPWPKECDNYCTGEALKKADYGTLTKLFGFEPNLTRKIIKYREDPRLQEMTIFERLEKGLSPREMDKVRQSVKSLDPNAQKDIIRRGIFGDHRLLLQ